MTGKDGKKYKAKKPKRRKPAEAKTSSVPKLRAVPPPPFDWERYRGYSSRLVSAMREVDAVLTAWPIEQLTNDQAHSAWVSLLEDINRRIQRELDRRHRLTLLPGGKVEGTHNVDSA